jgi:hypothetical protein
MAKLGKHRVEHIHWIDSHSRIAWIDESDVVPDRADMETIGAVIKETRDFIVVTHTRSGNGLVNDPFTIPKSAITKRRRL